jgi:hypothetical protein
MTHKWQRYSDEQVLEVVRLYKSGLGPHRIEDVTGIPANYVDQLIRGRCRVRLTGGRIVRGYREQYRADAARYGHAKRKSQLV